MDLPPHSTPMPVPGWSMGLLQGGKGGVGDLYSKQGVCFSQGCENQDTFPWGLFCPIKLKQISLADGITAPASLNLITFTCWLEHTL